MPYSENSAKLFGNSLDHLANSIASATFDVINEGKVRTADMGGEKFNQDIQMQLLNDSSSLHTGSATTSEFTSAVIKKL